MVDDSKEIVSSRHKRTDVHVNTLGQHAQSLSRFKPGGISELRQGSGQSNLPSCSNANFIILLLKNLKSLDWQYLTPFMSYTNLSQHKGSPNLVLWPSLWNKGLALSAFLE